MARKMMMPKMNKGYAHYPVYMEKYQGEKIENVQLQTRGK